TRSASRDCSTIATAATAAAATRFTVSRKHKRREGSPLSPFVFIPRPKGKRSKHSQECVGEGCRAAGTAAAPGRPGREACSTGSRADHVAHVLERVAGVGAQEADGANAHDDDQGQHHGVFDGGGAVFIFQKRDQRTRDVRQHGSTSQTRWIWKPNELRPRA